jgi:hypothetical protein
LIQEFLNVGIELSARLLLTLFTRGTDVVTKLHQRVLNQPPCRFGCAIVVVLPGGMNSSRY